MIKHHITFGAKEIILPRLSGKTKTLLLSFNPKTDYKGSNYNGYGYQDHDYFYALNKKDFKIFSDFITEKQKAKKPAAPKTFDQKKMAWCKRLAKLTGITLDQAEKIADAKLDYKWEKINMIEDRQGGHYSSQREKLINKMRRENPLRRIEDADHAFAILEAHERHTQTNYDDMLEEARELASVGIIDKGSIKDYARRERI